MTDSQDESHVDQQTTPSAFMFEVACECGAVLSVYSRSAERPRVACPSCGLEADSELATGEPWDVEGFDKAGPDVQVRVAWQPGGVGRSA